jgi:hypothetical protein
MTGLLTFSLEFRGEVTEDGDGLVLRASAPSCTRETRVRHDGIAARFLFGDCDEEAFLESRLVFAGDGTFSEAATVDFCHGNVLWGRTVDDGRIVRSADRHLRHGSGTIHVVDGRGQFAGATGQITSNFVISDTGELTDNQLGMLFLRPDLAEAV